MGEGDPRWIEGDESGTRQGRGNVQVGPPFGSHDAGGPGRGRGGGREAGERGSTEKGERGEREGGEREREGERKKGRDILLLSPTVQPGGC